MEAQRIVWATDRDELAVVAELLQREIKTYAAMQTMPNVVKMTACEASRYDLIVNIYNQIVQKL